MDRLWPLAAVIALRECGRGRAGSRGQAGIRPAWLGMRRRLLKTLPACAARQIRSPQSTGGQLGPLQAGHRHLANPPSLAVLSCRSATALTCSTAHLQRINLHPGPASALPPRCWVCKLSGRPAQPPSGPAPHSAAARGQLAACRQQHRGPWRAPAASGGGSTSALQLRPRRTLTARIACPRT